MENDMTEVDVGKLTKELRITRIFCVISSMLTGCLLVGALILFINLAPIFTFLQETQVVIEQLATLDIEEVNHTLEQVNSTLESVDWQQVSETLGQLDVEAINEAIEGLDTEAISEAIENLNKTAEVLGGWGEKLGSIF